MSSHRARVARAFIIAPLAAPAACVIALVGVSVVQALAGPSSPPSFGSALELTAAVFAVGTPVAYAAALLAAMLTYVTGRRGTIPSRRTLWILGAILGLVASLALAPYLRGDLFSIRFPWWAGSLLGIISAEACWRLLPKSRDSSHR